MEKEKIIPVPKNGGITHKQAEKYIRATITETVNGILEWLKNDVIIVDMKTGKEIPGAELQVIDKSKKPQEYISPLLEKHGIIFKF